MKANKSKAIKESLDNILVLYRKCGLRLKYRPCPSCRVPSGSMGGPLLGAALAAVPFEPLWDMNLSIKANKLEPHALCSGEGEGKLRFSLPYRVFQESCECSFGLHWYGHFQPTVVVEARALCVWGRQCGKFRCLLVLIVFICIA